MAAERTTTKKAARSAVDGAQDALVELSHRIYASPEVAFEEVRAAAWVADALADGGFAVEAGVCDLPTAFSARTGSGPLHVAICAEYDALPGIGHACGHNVIAAAAVGAGLALAGVADDAGLTVTVLGTPAEEGGGGKVLMLERGGFAGVHAAMMVHPTPYESDHFPTMAATEYDVRYRGKEAHASAFPDQGINAADAMTVAQVGIGLLRQHFRPGDQVHGFVESGGEAPNVVPRYAWGRWMMRAPTLAKLAELEPRVRACFEAGALATGAALEMERNMPPYSEFTPDEDLRRLYRANAEALGRSFPERQGMTGGSTDMANVSLELPTIHPLLGLDSFPVVNHQAAFAHFCATPVADRAVVDGAVAMAWTCLDAAADDAVRDRLLARTNGG